MKGGHTFLILASLVFVWGLSSEMRVHALRKERDYWKQTVYERDEEIRQAGESWGAALQESNARAAMWLKKLNEMKRGIHETQSPQ